MSIKAEAATEAERIISDEMHAEAITQALPFKVGFVEGALWQESRVSQAVEVQPPKIENLGIVNGWLVERGAHPLDYPAGAAYGSMPYSDAEPLINLSEITGWPLRVEVTDEMVEKAARALDPDAFSDPLVGYGEGAAKQAREWAFDTARDVLDAVLGGEQ
jgi:hypothetical protein